MFELACRVLGLLCVMTTADVPPPHPHPAAVRRDAACRLAAEQDANGEVVSVAIGGQVLHAGDFGREVFLRGPKGRYGWIYGGTGMVDRHCRDLLDAVFGPAMDTAGEAAQPR